MSSKRKHVVLTIEEKLRAVKRIKNGESMRNVAGRLGVGVSTVSDWVKAKEKLEKHSSNVPNRKTMKPAQYQNVNEALFLWFKQENKKGTPLPGPTIQEKAKEFAEKLGQTTFTASNGWLDRWKSRYCVRELHLWGEKLTTDPMVQSVENKDGESNSELSDWGKNSVSVKNLFNELEDSSDEGTGVLKKDDVVTDTSQQQVLKSTSDSSFGETTHVKNPESSKNSVVGKRKNSDQPRKSIGRYKKQKIDNGGFTGALDDGSATWRNDDHFSGRESDLDEPLLDDNDNCEVNGSFDNKTSVTTEHTDEYTIFGLYIACKLRKLKDKRLSATAQNRINNYLFELEMGNLEAEIDNS